MDSIFANTKREFRMTSRPTRIGSLKRAINLLVVLARMPPDVRKPRVLAEANGLALSSTYHLLSTFEDSGLLPKDTVGCYQFGPTFDLLAEAHYRNDRLPASVAAAVRNLANATGESAYFSTWRRGKIEMLLSVLGSNAVQVAALPSGFRGVEHARASGKLLLALSDELTVQPFLQAESLKQVTEYTITRPFDLRAELARVRELGYATESEEFILGVGCASLPIYAHKRLYGALAISAPIQRFESSLKSLIATVREAADGVQIVPERDEEPVSIGPQSDG